MTSGVATGKIFSCDQTFHEIINALFHSAHDKQRLWFRFSGSKEQSSLHSSLKVCELGQANSYDL